MSFLKHSVLAILLATQTHADQPAKAYWLPGHGEPPIPLDEAFKKAAAAVAKADAVSNRWNLESVTLAPAFAKSEPTVTWRSYYFTFSRFIVRAMPVQQCTVTVEMNGKVTLSPITNKP